MIKLFGVILIISSAGLVGVRKSSALKKRSDCLKALRKMLFSVKLMLSFNAPTLPEIFARLRESAELSVLPFLRDVKSENPCDSVSSSAGFQSLPLFPKDKDIILDVFSSLGTTDLATQVSMLEFNIKRLDVLCSEADSERSVKSRLYSSVGFMGGILVAMLII